MKESLVIGITVMLLVSTASVTIGGSFEQEVGANDLMDDIIEIYTWEDLHIMRDDLTASYRLMNDLGPEDAGYDDYNTGEGWGPIGTGGSPFTGTLDGRNHVISGLFINSTSPRLGLFETIGQNGCVGNIGIVDVDITESGSLTRCCEKSP